MDQTTLQRKSLAELRQIAGALELKGYQRLRKAELVDRIVGLQEGGDDDAVQPTLEDAETSETSDTSDASDSSADEAPAPKPAKRSRAKDTDSADEEATARPRSRQRARSDQDNDDRPASSDDAGRDGDGSADERDERDAGDGDDDGGRRGRRNRNRSKSSNGNGNGGQDQFAGHEVREGVLDLLPEGYGFLRTGGYLGSQKDVYVSQSFVRRFQLRRGDLLGGPIRRHKNKNDKFPALGRIDQVEGIDADTWQAEQLDRPAFEDAAAIQPSERLRLNHGEDTPLALQLADVVAPLARGQRALVVGAPHAGATTILGQLITAIEANEPDVHLMVLLISERPETITEVERSTDAEVVSSTFDQPAEEHVLLAELALERARRRAERGEDVVVLVDSLTRLARAVQQSATPSGRTLPGGVDAGTLHPVRRFFGAARKLDGNGSLTIVAAAVVDTDAPLDAVVVQELRAVANSELVLDAQLAEQRILPAIDVLRSGTAREELLLSDDELAGTAALRRDLGARDLAAGTELMLQRLRTADDVETFLADMAKDGLG